MQSGNAAEWAHEQFLGLFMTDFFIISYSMTSIYRLATSLAGHTPNCKGKGGLVNACIYSELFCNKILLRPIRFGYSGI